MPRKLLAALALLTLTTVVAATAALAAPGRASDDPGITDTEILVGGTAPLSGRASAYASVAKGAEAYFAYVNSKGGVGGRKIRYTYLDDAYNPVQTTQVVRQLVEQEKVFAVFNTLGTEANLAIRPYLNAMKVPQALAASGATTWGRDTDQYPFTIGFQPSYQAEGWVYGKYLARTQGAARIAVLFQNDDYGKDLLNGIKKGLERSKAKVVAAEPYEATSTDVSAQIAKLKASGANTLAVFAIPPFSIQAIVIANKLGWRPKLTIVNAVGAASNLMQIASEGGTNKVAQGAISISFLKDPLNPAWNKDNGMKLYRDIMKRFGQGRDANDGYHVYGMAAAYTLVDALRRSGKTPTREGLVKALGSLNLRNNPFVIPGIAIKTSTGDHFPIEQVLLQRWQKSSWKSFGGLWGYRASS